MGELATLRLSGLAAFAALAVLTGWLLAVLLPLGQAADEGVHATRVDALSRGLVLAHREGTGGGFNTPATLMDVAKVTPAREPQTRADREKADAIRWGGPAVFLDLGTIATYFPAVYVPGAASIAMARALDATPAQAFRLGRQGNVLAYALVGALALAWARRGRALLAAVLLLPMSLGLAASLSGDGLLIALGALAAACITRGGRAWWVALGIVTVIGLTKLPYAALLLVVLAASGPALLARIGVGALSGVVMLGWAGYHQANVMGTIERPPYESGPLWPGPPATFSKIDPAAQLQVLKADPTRAVTLVAATLSQDAWTVRHMVGVLGSLHIVLPTWVYVMWYGVVGVSALGLAAEPGARAGPALLGLFGVLASIWAIMLAQYLGWTPVGATMIEGLQGRYYLPVLPFLAVCVPSLAAVRVPWLWALPLAAGFAGVAAVAEVVAVASYVR